MVRAAQTVDVRTMMLKPTLAPSAACLALWLVAQIASASAACTDAGACCERVAFGGATDYARQPGFIKGQWLPGRSNDVSTAASVEACAAQCDLETTCMSFHWRASGKRCNLKSVVADGTTLQTSQPWQRAYVAYQKVSDAPGASKGAGALPGQPALPYCSQCATQNAALCEFKPGIVGFHKVASFKMVQGGSVEECAALCLSDERCRAFPVPRKDTDVRLEKGARPSPTHQRHPASPLPCWVHAHSSRAPARILRVC